MFDMAKINIKNSTAGIFRKKIEMFDSSEPAGLFQKYVLQHKKYFGENFVA